MGAQLPWDKAEMNPVGCFLQFAGDVSETLETNVTQPKPMRNTKASASKPIKRTSTIGIGLSAFSLLSKKVKSYSPLWLLSIISASP